MSSCGPRRSSTRRSGWVHGALLVLLFSTIGTSSSAPAAGPPTRAPGAERIVAVGDLHGDLEAARRALRLAGAIDSGDRWVGGALVVVQTGDQLDRGDRERELLGLLERLSVQARSAGGAVYVLNGNHEFMNSLGDLRYVTRAGFADFEDVEVDADAFGDVPPFARSRLAAFWPGGPYAKRLASRNVIQIVGDSLFVHGGLSPGYRDGELEAINAEAQAWLDGRLARPPDVILHPDGPVWSRRYAGDPHPEDCALLEGLLARLAVTRMVVGHTVQEHGISAACDERVWRIDVGMAAFYGGTVQVLEIRGGEVHVLKE